VLAGSATTYFHALCAGCDGGILALASIFPDECVWLRELVRDTRLDEARALQRRLTPIARTIGTAHGVPALKAALDLLGYTGGPPRPPLRVAPVQVVDTLRSQLEALNALPLAH
jgi:4-hydroxy-2-oxoglutarate aldolase